MELQYSVMLCVPVQEFSAPHHIQWVRLLSGQLCVGYVSGFMMFSMQGDMIPLSKPMLLVDQLVYCVAYRVDQWG